METLETIPKPYSEDLPYINFYRYPVAGIPTKSNEELIIDIRNSESSDDTGLFTIYVGVPFCRVKCNSCHFFDQLLPGNDSHQYLLDEYLKQVLNQIQGVKSYGIFNERSCGAIFLGGGTASLLSSKQVSILIGELFDSFQMSENVEITLEGNPLEFNEQYLREVYNAGITRLSIGLQSFQDNLLKDVIGSPHNAMDSYNSIEVAMKIGFKTVNIDLLYGLPQQTRNSWEFELWTTLRYRPQNITTNWYVVLEGSKTQKLIQQNKLDANEMSVSDLNNLELWTNTYLLKAGYIEVRSGSFILPEHKQIYSTLTYSLGHELIGFGAGSYSFINGYFIEGQKYVNPYQKAIQAGNYLPIARISDNADRKTLMIRLIIMNLMGCSIDRKLFKERFGTDVVDEFGVIISKLLTNRLITIEASEVKLTSAGIKWKKHIMNEFYSC